MPLDPKAQQFLDQITAAGLPPFDAIPVEESRRLTASMFPTLVEPVSIAKSEDRRIPGAVGEIPVRIFTPGHARPYPVVVYLHGGGWVIGDIDSYDGTCRALANAVPAVVVSVGYRLAPEDKFPAAADDCYAATCWVADHAAEIGGDANRIAVAGDSAGGNLSAVVALMARDRGGPKLRHQVLIYPVTDANFDTPSYRQNANGYFLTQDMMRWFWDQYAPSPVARAHAYASPLRAQDLRGLPAATVITAEFDPLRDEGETYAARLREADVAVRLSRYSGMIHGFFTMTTVFDQAKQAMNEAAAALRGAFGV